jgi:hypothetical protein
MAKIYPEHLPTSVLEDPLRRSEQYVYTALAQMADDFVVFYSVAWQSRANGRARDGEADFVIAHPNFGILVLEVKGGSISFNAATGEWTTIGREGVQRGIKDPVEQARGSRYSLLEKLNELPGWDSNRFVNMAHAVCFPSINVPAESLRLDLPREIIIDRADIAEMQQAILRIFEYYASRERREPLGRERMQLVENLLAHSFSIYTLVGHEAPKIRTRLADDLKRDDEKLVELTDQQMTILQVLRKHRRAAIAGCAGSGKTLLAVEKAKKLEAQGFEVLLTCFNVALAQELKERLPETVAVAHFHGLCKEIAKDSGFSLRKPANDEEYNNIFLPEQLLNAAEEQGPMFDAIVVDEGQDFKETFWLGLSALLKPDGIFYVFYDDNQNLYGGTSILKGVIDEEPFTLSENCRNTQNIHKLVAKFHSQPGDLICRGPQGRAPELVYYSDARELTRQVQSKLSKLINEERISNSDIVILTPRGQERTQFKVGTRLGNFVLVDGPSRSQNGIQVSSIHSFKGLERQVVIMVEIDEYVRFTPEIVMYVGCSRARTYLVLFADQSTPPELKTRIEAAWNA